MIGVIDNPGTINFMECLNKMINHKLNPTISNVPSLMTRITLLDPSINFENERTKIDPEIAVI